MEWVYLSPHLDDVVLSCGGLIWEQVHSGANVSIWTICAGLIPDRPLPPFAQELHNRWKTGPDAVQFRREEDRQACERLGTTIRYFNIPDCIYRFQELGGEERPLIQGEVDLLGADPEPDLVEQIARMLEDAFPANAKIVYPMALGGHIDHRLTRAAAELCPGIHDYYADYPYILRSEHELMEMETGQWKRYPQPISLIGLEAWQDAIAAYSSQISTFWTGLDEVRLAIKNYWGGGGGRLWERVLPE